MIKEENFFIDGVRLNYVSYGQGDSIILFLHGAGGSYLGFLPLFPRLSLQFRLVALDFRGCGKSDHTPGTYDYETLVNDTYQFINQTIQKPVYIFGHSLGGMIGLLLAAKYPDLVKGIIVGDSPLNLTNFKSDKYTQEMLKFVIDMASSKTPMLDKINEIENTYISLPNNDEPVQFKSIAPKHEIFWRTITSTAVDPVFMKHHLDNFDITETQYDPKAFLPNVVCPVLLLQANKSLGGVMTKEDVKMGLDLLSNGYHAYIEKTGHGLHAQDLLAVLEPIASFFNILLLTNSKKEVK